MPSQLKTFGCSSVLIFILPNIVSCGAEANNNNVTCVGLIVDVYTRIGKEEIIAMVILVENCNSNSKTHKLSLYISRTPSFFIENILTLPHIVNEKSILYVPFKC